MVRNPASRRGAPQGARLVIARVVLAVLLLTTSAAGALLAVAHAPPARVDVAGRTCW